MGGIMAFYAYIYRPDIFNYSLSFSPAFFFISTCGLSYAYTVLNDGSAAESLTNLVKGLYLYNQAANEYFG